jgi:hypothetical protein
MAYSCLTCGLTSNTSDHCANAVCPDNPANYPQQVCLDPNCNICIKDNYVKEKVCKCGSEAVSGKTARHSAWCPRFAVE